jgi:anti-anti-sigma regulatory factor
MPETLDQRSAFLHLQTVRGHLVARILCPNVGQREVPIIAQEAGEAILLMSAQGGGKRFVLDVSLVGTLSSMGLGMCVDLRNRASHAGLKPALFGANTSLQQLLRLMKIDRQFQMVADAAALDRLLG